MKKTVPREVFFSKLDSASQILTLFDYLAEVSFFVKNRKGEFMALNRRGCEYCGVVSEEDAFGKTDHDFFPKVRADEYRDDDQRVMDSGK